MDTTDDAGWPSSWSRPFLTLCALTIIEADPQSHGYAIMTALKQELGAKVTGGVIYPLLRSLEDDRLLSSKWEPGDGGPGRKEYALTEEGIANVARLRQEWNAFSRRISAIVEQQTRKDEAK